MVINYLPLAELSKHFLCSWLSNSRLLRSTRLLRNPEDKSVLTFWKPLLSLKTLFKLLDVSSRILDDELFQTGNRLGTARTKITQSSDCTNSESLTAQHKLAR